MSKHTPGSWTHEPGSWFVGSPSGNVALVNMQQEAQEADATLIAAAPDLLAALTMAKNELQRLRNVHLPQYEGKIGEPELHPCIDAAIAKATGGQKDD